MRVLITGGAGLLGSTLITGVPKGVELHATQRRAPVHGSTAHRVDLAVPPAVSALLKQIRPAIVFHTAYGMDDPQRDIVEASGAVAQACAAVGAALIHISTDRVLDGENSPYDESAAPAPVDDYGRWKAAAERAVLTAAPDAALVRTSLIVRTDPLDAGTESSVRALRKGEPLRLFVDELRCPIHVDDLAQQLWEVAALPADKRSGVWNLVGPEALSRFALGVLIARRFSLDTGLLVPSRHRDHPTPRSRDLRLSTTRADREISTRARTITEALLDG